MSFQDIILKILHVWKGKYYPHVTGSGSIPSISDAVRNDYDNIRSGNIHGGVDIIYGERVNGTLTWIGCGHYPNPNSTAANVPVYAPVLGEIVVAQDGRVSILDNNGYIHTIYHLTNVSDTLLGTEITEENLNTLVLGTMSNVGVNDVHVHYEITTYYEQDDIPRIQKIDPEAFWDNYPASADGFFTLSGSYKKGNQFYGTSRKEILKGEGVKDADQAKYANFNDNDTLSGGGGADIIDGGTGDDKLYGGNSYGENKYYNIVKGVLKKTPEVTEDTDTSTEYLIGGAGKDYLDGGKGNDVLYGGVATIANGQVTYNESEDTDTSRDTLKGGAGNDVIYGGGGDDWLWGDEGADVLRGGTGDDMLIGGIGDDILMGGENDDTYVINAGDGVDRIEDKQSENNKIFLCGEIINFFYDTDTGQYKSPDGTLTGEIIAGEFHVTAISGTEVILNDDFQWGDFGTTLIDLPDDISELPEPEVTNTIVGDLAPVDMDPNQPGIQYGYDQWGNVIVDPSQSSPDREDYLYDTSGNDKIYAGGGDDYVLCDVGGANWILGGDGYDNIDGENSSSTIIEGGAGSDIIIGGVNGNNQLFGDSRGNGDMATIMAAHIAAGETALDSGVRGDIVAADGENSNFLYGLLRLPAPHFSLFHDKKATVVI